MAQQLFSGDASYMVSLFVSKIGAADRDWFETRIHRFIHKQEVTKISRLCSMADGYKAGISLHVQTNNDYLHVKVDQGEPVPVQFILRRVGDSVELVSSIG